MTDDYARLKSLLDNLAHATPQERREAVDMLGAEIHRLNYEATENIRVDTLDKHLDAAKQLQEVATKLAEVLGLLCALCTVGALEG